MTPISTSFYKLNGYFSTIHQMERSLIRLSPRILALPLGFYHECKSITSHPHKLLGSRVIGGNLFPSGILTYFTSISKTKWNTFLLIWVSKSFFLLGIFSQWIYPFMSKMKKSTRSTSLKCSRNIFTFNEKLSQTWYQKNCPSLNLVV